MMDVVLRKRVSVNIYKKQSLTSKFVRSIIGTGNTYYETAVIYEIVSNIPKVRELLYFLSKLKLLILFICIINKNLYYTIPFSTVPPSPPYLTSHIPLTFNQHLY